MSKRTATVGMAALLVFSSIACGPEDTGTTGTTIGVSLLTRSHVFYRDLEDGLNDGAYEHGYRLLVNAAEWDAGRQIAQLEDFITRGVDAIIVCPVDSSGIGAGVKAANRAGIPVFTADIASFSGDVVAHIASDNVAGGRLAGQYLVDLLGGSGKVAIINQPIVTSTLDRVQGFREVVQRYPEIDIVADVNGDGVRDRALRAASDVLQAQPDLDGIFAINDDSALGTLDAVEDFGRDDIVIVGYDATPPARDAILKGRALKADVVQYPYEIGRKTIDTIAQHLAGRPVPKVVPVEVGIVDREALLAMQSSAPAEPVDVPRPDR
jgi:ribose transport system substrate-binding protein